MAVVSSPASTSGLSQCCRSICSWHIITSFKIIIRKNIYLIKWHFKQMNLLNIFKKITLKPGKMTPRSLCWEKWLLFPCSTTRSWWAGKGFTLWWQRVMLEISLLNLLIGIKENDGIKPYSIEIKKEELTYLISSPKTANKVMQLVK